MNSFTRALMAPKLDRMVSGISSVVRITKGMEMPSRPMWKVMGPSQGLSSTNWNCAVPGSKSRHSSSEMAKVMSVVHSAM